jgi:ribosomal protein S19
MSRSNWKPSFRHPQVMQSIASKQIVTKNRATCITSSIVDHKCKVGNGRRWFNLAISQEIVGTRLGQYAPTRKRPILKKKVIKNK